MRKYDLISTLSAETSKRVVRNEENWKEYLNTASRIYKYPFKDKLLIYAQRPDAMACASIEIWNEKMHCWVNRGAKGIALIDEESNNPSGLRYVFDISDVHKARRIGRFPYLWVMKEEHQETVLERLERIYGDTNRENGFVERIGEIASRIAQDCYQELALDVEYLKEGSFLEELDGLNIAVHVRETLANSIAYTVLKRCGMEDAELSKEIEFPYIHEFNTVETLSHIGDSISDLSKPILMEIGKAIRVYDRENTRSAEIENLDEKELANASDMYYNTLKRESETQGAIQTGNAGERGNNDEFDLREERGLSDTDATDGRAAGGDADEIRDDEEELLTGTQEGRLHGASVERQAEGTSPGHSGAGRAADGITDSADGESRRRDGGTESGRSDEMGGADEQHQMFGRGNRAERIDIQPVSENTIENGNLTEPDSEEALFGFSLPETEVYQQLSLFPAIEEQIGTISAAQAGEKYIMPATFSLAKEQLEVILRTGGGRSNSRSRIYAKYQQGKTPEEMAEFLKNEYQTTGKGFDFGENPISVWFNESGMSIGYGMSAKDNPVEVMDWQQVEGVVRSMVEHGSYMGANEVFLVDEVERQRVSNDLFFFFSGGHRGNAGKHTNPIL